MTSLEPLRESIPPYALTCLFEAFPYQWRGRNYPSDILLFIVLHNYADSISLLPTAYCHNHNEFGARSESFDISPTPLQISTRTLKNTISEFTAPGKTSRSLRDNDTTSSSVEASLGMIDNHDKNDR